MAFNWPTFVNKTVGTTEEATMTLKAAFIFLSPDADSGRDRSVVTTKNVELTAVAARNYHDAVAIALDLSNAGVLSIELCGGFGHAGTALVAEAVANKTSVGVVRFDNHPGLDGASGDSLFAK
jgi:hypothetical protein